MSLRSDRVPLSWLPPLIGSVAVVAVAAVLAVALSSSRADRPTPGPAQPVGPLIDQVGFSSIVGEYRGWLQVAPGSLTVTVTAPRATDVRVRHWLSSEDSGPAERTQPQSDGTWVVSWPVEAGTSVHVQAEATGVGGTTETSDTYNISAASQPSR